MPDACGCNERVDVAVYLGLIVPVGMEIFLLNDTLDHYVFQMALPAMTPFVGREAVEHRLIRGLLQVDVERCVDLGDRLRVPGRCRCT